MRRNNTSSGNKNIDSNENTGTWMESRLKYLTEKAKLVEFPTEEDAHLEPKFMFDGDSLVIYMCFACRLVNKKSSVTKMDDDHEKLELVLCRICRAHHNRQRQSKFFNLDVMIHKKEQEGKKN